MIVNGQRPFFIQPRWGSAVGDASATPQNPKTLMVPPQIADSRCYQVQGLPLAHPNPAVRHPKTKTNFCFSNFFFRKKNSEKKKLKFFQNLKIENVQQSQFFSNGILKFPLQIFNFFFENFYFFSPKNSRFFQNLSFFEKIQNFKILRKNMIFFRDPTDFTLPWTAPARLEWSNKILCYLRLPPRWWTVPDNVLQSQCHVPVEPASPRICVMAMGKKALYKSLFGFDLVITKCTVARASRNDHPPTRPPRWTNTSIVSPRW